MSVQSDKQFATTRARFLPGVASSVVEGLLGEIDGIISSSSLWTAWQVVANSLEGTVTERAAVLGRWMRVFRAGWHLEV